MRGLARRRLLRSCLISWPKAIPPIEASAPYLSMNPDTEEAPEIAAAPAESRGDLDPKLRGSALPWAAGPVGAAGAHYAEVQGPVDQLQRRERGATS